MYKKIFRIGKHQKKSFSYKFLLILLAFTLLTLMIPHSLTINALANSIDDESTNFQITEAEDEVGSNLEEEQQTSENSEYASEDNEEIYDATNNTVTLDISGSGTASWDKESVNVPVGTLAVATWDSEKMAPATVTFKNPNNGEVIETATLTPEAGPHDETWIRNINPPSVYIYDDSTEIVANIYQRYPLWITYQDFNHPSTEIYPKLQKMLELDEYYYFESPFVYDEETGKQWIIHEPSWEIISGNMPWGGMWYQVGYHEFQHPEPQDWTFGRIFSEDPVGTYNLGVPTYKIDQQTNAEVSFTGDTDTRMFAGEIRIDQNSDTNSNTFNIAVPDGFMVSSVTVTGRVVYDGDTVNFNLSSGDDFQTQTITDHYFNNYTFNGSWTDDVQISFDDFQNMEECGIFNIGVTVVPVAPQETVSMHGSVFRDGNNPAINTLVTFVSDNNSNITYEARTDKFGNYTITGIPAGTSGDVFAKIAYSYYVGHQEVTTDEHDIYNVNFSLELCSYLGITVHAPKVGQEFHDSFYFQHFVDESLFETKNIDKSGIDFIYYEAKFYVDQNMNLIFDWESPSNGLGQQVTDKKIYTAIPIEGSSVKAWFINEEELVPGKEYLIQDIDDRSNFTVEYTEPQPPIPPDPPYPPTPPTPPPTPDNPVIENISFINAQTGDLTNTSSLIAIATLVIFASMFVVTIRRPKKINTTFINR